MKIPVCRFVILYRNFCRKSISSIFTEKKKIGDDVFTTISEMIYLDFWGQMCIFFTIFKWIEKWKRAFTLLKGYKKECMKKLWIFGLVGISQQGQHDPPTTCFWGMEALQYVWLDICVLRNTKTLFHKSKIS